VACRGCCACAGAHRSAGESAARPRANGPGGGASGRWLEEAIAAVAAAQDAGGPTLNGLDMIAARACADAVRQAGGNLTEVAKLLGASRQRVSRLLGRYPR
jgi:hypothetical protein